MLCIPKTGKNDFKVIKIRNHNREIGDDEFDHPFDGGNLYEIKGDEDSIYYLDIHIVQEKTNSVLRVQKEFEGYNSAKIFLRNFYLKILFQKE